MQSRVFLEIDRIVFLRQAWPRQLQLLVISGAQAKIIRPSEVQGNTAFIKDSMDLAYQQQQEIYFVLTSQESQQICRKSVKLERLQKLESIPLTSEGQVTAILFFDKGKEDIILQNPSLQARQQTINDIVQISELQLLKQSTIKKELDSGSCSFSQFIGQHQKQISRQNVLVHYQRPHMYQKKQPLLPLIQPQTKMRIMLQLKKGLVKFMQSGKREDQLLNWLGTYLQQNSHL